MKLAKVFNSEAAVMVPRLISGGFADPSAKICKHNGYRLVPLFDHAVEDVNKMGLEIICGTAFTRDVRSPQNRIKAELSLLPSKIISELPMRWEYVGDIVVIRLSEEAIPYGEQIGEAYAKVLDAKTVCADIHGVSGEFRRPSMEILFGNDTESIRLENGVRYKFDVTKVMFASGNVDERNRMKHLDCAGETIVDMFAGIGYFTLPIAKFSGAVSVIACEKNPDSFRYLCENTILNDVENIVRPVLGDNRDLKINDADRIIMGYVQRTSDFLEKAVSMIRPGGIIHYHDTFYINEYNAKIGQIFSKVCGKDGFSVIGIKEVKSFAPSVSHYVADVRIL